jgi:hypothetical protein
MKLRSGKKCAPRIRFQEGAGYLVAVDSGARKAGVALFYWESDVKRATLVAAATIETPTDEALPAEVYAWVEDMTLDNESASFHWVVERPLKYNNRSRYHKDLDRLLKFIQDFPVKWDAQLLPREWKGNVGSTLRKTKDIYHRRMFRAMSQHELVITADEGPDALDAVGIGLYTLGRIGRGGTLCRT